MANVTTKVDLVINRLSQQKYDQLSAAGLLNPNQLYVTSGGADAVLETRLVAGKALSADITAADISSAIGLDNYLTAVPSDYKTYAQTKQSLSGDGYTTQEQLNEKSAVSVDNVKADVNMVHISLDDYSDKLIGDEILSNELYVVSSDYVETYGQQIKNVADPTDLSDAVNKEYVDSNFQPAGNYLTAVPSDYKTYAATLSSLSSTYSLTSHTHSQYSLTSHTHSNYVLTSRTVAGMQLTGNVTLKNLSFGSKNYNGSTALTVTAGDLGALTAVSAVYVNQHIRLSANNALVGNIDCSDFVKDGMLSAVELCSDQLIFIFNAESGKTAISVALSNFIDETNYYTKTETSSAIELSDAFSAKADISGSLISVEWADLTALADAEELVPGQKYRITDYVTTVDQEDCRSAGHPFDLIVTAIDHHTLDENARATIHDGDDYFAARPFHVADYQQYLEYARVPLESWDIKYCLDNDKTRFKFADTTNGKGVIYYMKDEFGNEAPYDFKNVQFKRYKITSSPGASDLEGMYGLAVGDIEVDTSDEMWCYTFNGADYADFGFSEPYDFSGWHVRPTQAVLQQFGGPSIERLQECAGNVIQARQQDENDFSLMSFKLPNNVFHCVLDQAPVSELPFIKIGICSANKLGNGCYSNTFGNGCYSNTFGYGCYSNTFGNGCGGNTFGNGCDSNTFGNSCNSNTFGNGCDSNTFGNGCDSNTFGYYCGGNTFGNGCDSNTFGNSCNSNTFGDSCYSIKFASTATSDPNLAKSYYRCITVDSGNQYIILNCTQSTYSGNEYKNVRILPGVNNTTSYKTITDSNVNQSFCTTYQPANSQVIAV